MVVKNVLDNITKIELAAADAQEFDFAIAQQPDSIAQLCTIVRRVCIFFKSISNIFNFIISDSCNISSLTNFLRNCARFTKSRSSASSRCQYLVVIHTSYD